MQRFPVLMVVVASFVALGECTITLNVDNQRIGVGTTISITCTISDGETFEGWYKTGNNGRKITTRPDDRINYKSEGDRHTLRISKAQAIDHGGFECRTITGNKKVFTLSILFEFQAPVKNPQYLRLFQSASVEVTVIGEGPRPTVTWSKCNAEGKQCQTLQITSNSRYEKLASGSLRIKRVEKSDAGKYKCLIEQAGLEKEVFIDVIPTSPPVILVPPHPEKRYVTAGYNTSFRCLVDGSPKPKIQWLNPVKQPVSTFDPRYEIKDDTLYIYRVQSSDKGVWTCNVTQGDIYVSASAEILDVYEAPVITEPRFPWVYYPELFKLYTIACKASGYPKPTVIIRKDGRIHPRLDAQPGEAFIRFFLVRVHDLGNYSCEAWSSARDSNDDVIVVNQTFAMFTKDKPYVNDQGSPNVIYSYVGNPKPLKINCDFVSWPKANVTIWRGFYELTNGTDQATLYVWTYSWEDFGPYSCIGSNIYGEVNYTVFIKHATPPAKPANIKVYATCNRANITWDPPENTGGMEIERYVIGFKDQPREKFNTNDSYPEWRFSNLKANTEYSISIRAMNRQGAGQKADVVFRTNSTCIPKRPIVFSPVEENLDRTFLDLRWKLPENAGNDDTFWYLTIVKEKDDLEGIGHIKVYSTTDRVQRIGGLRKNVTYRFEVYTMTMQDQQSDPTYVIYHVEADAYDSAHGLSASFWCVLLGLFITYLRY